MTVYDNRRHGMDLRAYELGLAPVRAGRAALSSAKLNLGEGSRDDKNLNPQPHSSDGEG